MKAVATGWNMYGEPITVEGTELLARALQHETDHLNGVLFIDRLAPELRKQAMKDIRQAEWFLESQEKGWNPEIKVSPHSTFGRNL
jgi:peptide deformylase